MHLVLAETTSEFHWNCIPTSVPHIDTIIKSTSKCDPFSIISQPKVLHFTKRLLKRFWWTLLRTTLLHMRLSTYENTLSDRPSSLPISPASPVTSSYQLHYYLPPFATDTASRFISPDNTSISNLWICCTSNRPTSFISSYFQYSWLAPHVRFTDSVPTYEFHSQTRHDFPSHSNNGTIPHIFWGIMSWVNPPDMKDAPEWHAGHTNWPPPKCLYAHFSCRSLWWCGFLSV